MQNCRANSRGNTQPTEFGRICNNLFNTCFMILKKHATICVKAICMLKVQDFAILDLLENICDVTSVRAIKSLLCTVEKSLNCKSLKN